MRFSRVIKAADELERLILADGCEYPDAEWEASSLYDLTDEETEELRAEYDRRQQ